MPYVYHGTSEYNALLIQSEGFKKGTYFTPHLDSALVMGGEYVFAVWLENGEYDSLPWMKAGEDAVCPSGGSTAALRRRERSPSAGSPPWTSPP